ncbi:hypothetical protein D3C85_1470050 [compost metagenome]
MVGARQQNATQGSNQHQQVELFAVVRVTDQPRIGKGTGSQTRQYHQPGIEHRVAVNPQQRGDIHWACLADKVQRKQRQV